MDEGDGIKAVARVEGIVDTIKWSILLGFTLLAILISVLKIV